MKQFVNLNKIGWFSLVVILFMGGCHGKKGPINEKSAADSFAKMPDPTARIASLEKFIIDYPKSAPLAHELALSYEETGNLDKALEQTKISIQNDTANASYYFYMTDLFMKKPSVKNAINTLERLAMSQPKNKMVYVKMAEIYISSGKNDESLKAIEKALKVDPNIPEAWFWRGYNFREMKKTDKAIESFQKAVELKPDYEEAYVILGLLYQERKDAKAAAYFTTAIRLNPKDTLAIYDRGKYYQDIDSFKKAIDDYKLILNLDPNRRGANFGIGYCLYYMKNYSDALGYFSKVLINNPKDASAHYARGLCYKAMGDFDKARKEQEIYEKLTASEKGK